MAEEEQKPSVSVGGQGDPASPPDPANPPDPPTQPDPATPPDPLAGAPQVAKEDSGGGMFSGANFWTGPFLAILGIGLAALLGAGWYILGGLPRDHDKYGEVVVPGRAVLALPGEEVRLDFENHASQSGDSTHLDDQPAGLDVRITPAAGGEAVEIEDVPSWLFSSTVNDRGHEPWGKADVPSAGDYVVETTDDSAGPFQPPGGASPPASEDEPNVDQGAAISVGAKPWNPFGSVIAGAILVAMLVLLAMFAFSLPFRLLRNR